MKIIIGECEMELIPEEGGTLIVSDPSALPSTDELKCLFDIVIQRVTLMKSLENLRRDRKKE